MNLIERYVDEVGSFLPDRIRSDVGDELRSNLEEALDDRLASGDWESTREAEIALLQEFGPPHLLAESYMTGPRILFGPRLFPAFLRTMKIAISILAGVIALGLVVDFTHMTSATELWASVADSVQKLLIWSLFVLGVVVAIFAGIERSRGEMPPAAKPWSPTDLEDEDDPNEISVTEVVVGVVFLVLSLVVLNVFPEWLAIWVNLDEHSGTVPILTDGFWSQLWLLNTCLALDLGLSLVLLRKGQWTTPLLWTRVAITLLFVAWFARLTYGPPILELDAAALLDQGWPASAVDHLVDVVRGRILPVLGILLRLGFGAAVIGLCVRIYNTTKRTLGRS